MKKLILSLLLVFLFAPAFSQTDVQNVAIAERRLHGPFSNGIGDAESRFFAFGTRCARRVTGAHQTEIKCLGGEGLG